MENDEVIDQRDIALAPLEVDAKLLGQRYGGQNGLLLQRRAVAKSYGLRQIVAHILPTTVCGESNLVAPALDRKAGHWIFCIGLGSI